MKMKVLNQRNAVFVPNLTPDTDHVLELSNNDTRVGMCVLAWDQCPLEGSTFEEVRRLVKSTSSSHVMLTVTDCRSVVLSSIDANAQTLMIIEVLLHKHFLPEHEQLNSNSIGLVCWQICPVTNKCLHGTGQLSPAEYGTNCHVVSLFVLPSESLRNTHHPPRHTPPLHAYQQKLPSL